MRADIGRCTHAFTADCREAGIRVLGRLLADRRRPRRDHRGPGSPMAAGDQRRRRGTSRGVGDRANRPRRSLRLARGLRADLPPRTSAPPARNARSSTSTAFGTPASSPTRTARTSRRWSCVTAVARGSGVDPLKQGHRQCAPAATPKSRRARACRRSPSPSGLAPGARPSVSVSRQPAHIRFPTAQNQEVSALIPV